MESFPTSLCMGAVTHQQVQKVNTQAAGCPAFKSALGGEVVVWCVSVCVWWCGGCVVCVFGAVCVCVCVCVGVCEVISALELGSWIIIISPADGAWGSGCSQVIF